MLVSFVKLMDASSDFHAKCILAWDAKLFDMERYEFKCENIEV